MVSPGPPPRVINRGASHSSGSLQQECSRPGIVRALFCLPLSRFTSQLEVGGNKGLRPEEKATSCPLWFPWGYRFSHSWKPFLAVSPDYSDLLQQVPEGTFYRFPLIPVHGVPLMQPIATSWEKIKKFQARPDDLLIATYPKAGTTWMQEIIDSIMNDGEVEKTRRAPTHVRSPLLEIFSPPPVPSGIDMLEETLSPRLVKTHLPYDLVPQSFWEQKCKVIYVARNAKDNAVSYYFFDQMNKTQPDPGTWDEYVLKFLKGDVAWGGWFDHVLGWWNARDKHDVLYVFYEDMKEDPKREIRKVMRFLGKELPEDAVEKIYQHTSFSAMKENPMANYSSMPSNVLDQKVSPFMRKGQVADWMNHFTESQNKIFDEEYRRRMEGSTLKFRCIL